MGQKQSSYDRQTQGYNVGYSSYDQSKSPDYVGAGLGGSSPSDLNVGYMKGWQTAAEDAARKNANQGGGFEMPDFSSLYQPVDYTEVFAKQKADAEKAAGLAQVTDLYSKKFDAAEKATADVTQQIADEMGHAKVVGLDYTIDDATKQKRINDVFANYWGEGDESALSGLVGQWGDAGYAWDLPIVRGDATKGTTTDKTAGDKVGKKVKSKGAKLSTAEDPLATAPILG